MLVADGKPEDAFEPESPGTHLHETAPFLSDEADSWPVIASNDLHRDEWVVALRSDFLRPPSDHLGQHAFHRLVLEHPGSVVVLAINEEFRVLCLRQYRHAGQRKFVELPAGLCDVADEVVLETAKRELREEARLIAKSWTPLSTTWTSAGISTELVHVFVAEDLSPTESTSFVPADEEAEMDCLWVDFNELLEAVLVGRVQNAQLVIAVLAYHVRRSCSRERMVSNHPDNS